MNKEFKRDLANMFSLMERMEKHATLNEAEGNKNFYVNEAYSPNGAKVFVDIYSTGNNNYGVKIGGIWAEDAEEINANFGVDVIPDPNNKMFAYLDFGECGTIEEIVGLIQENIVDTGVFDVATGQYDKASVANLSNKDTWHFATGGRDVPDDKQKLLSDIKNKNIAQLKQDLANMLSSNDYSSFDANKLGQLIINLERQYGNQLSQNNIRAIEEQAANYGLQPGDPDYPTFVVSEKTWVEVFGRQVKPDAKYPYYIEANKARQSSKKTKVEKAQARGWDVNDKNDLDDLSAQVNYKLGFNDDEKNYGRSKAFNITDTEDVTGVDKFLNEMGLLNNLTGELNDLAKKDKEEYEKRKEAAMNPEELEAHNEEKRTEIEVKLLGKTLEVVCNNMFSLNVKFNENAPLQSYINLIRTAVEKSAEGKILKKDRLNAVVSCASLFIANRLKGIGAQELFQIAQKDGAVGPYGTGKQYADDIISIAQPILKGIERIYPSIEKDYVDAHSAKQQATAQAATTSDDAQSYSPVAEAVLKKMEKLMKDPIVVDGKTLF